MLPIQHILLLFFQRSFALNPPVSPPSTSPILSLMTSAALRSTTPPLHDTAVDDVSCDDILPSLVDATNVCRRWRLCIGLVVTCLCIETIVILSMGAHVYNPRYANFTTEAKNPGKVQSTAPSPVEFLDNYQSYCEQFLIPKHVDTHDNGTNKDLCPCVPNGLRKLQFSCTLYVCIIEFVFSSQVIKQMF